MTFLKYIFELVIVYYILKFVLSFISNLFFVKQTINKAKENMQFNDANNNGANSSANNTSTKSNFEPAKQVINIKDGEYIEYEDVTNKN